MATKFHQISLNETFSDCQDIFIDDTPSFFQHMVDFTEPICQAINTMVPQKRMFSSQALPASLPWLLPTA